MRSSFLVFSFFLLFPASVGFGQNLQTETRGSHAMINSGVVRLVADGLAHDSNKYMRIARDLALTLDKIGEMRVLPMMGYGTIRNVADLIFLRGVDLAIVHSDVLTYLRQIKLLPDAGNRLRYVVNLFSKTFHVVARKDIKVISDLNNKPVVIGAPDSGSEMSAKTLLRFYGVKPKFVRMSWSEALNRLATGDIAAMVYPDITPSPLLADIKSSGKIHLLALPTNRQISRTYKSSLLTHTDYPNLIPEGRKVPSLQFGTVLATYDWKPENARLQDINRFILKFLNNIEALQAKSGNPLWSNLNVADRIPGWQRYGPVGQWMKQNQYSNIALRRAAKSTTMLAHRQRFFQFLESQGKRKGRTFSSNQKNVLFKQLLASLEAPPTIWIKMNWTSANESKRYVGAIEATNSRITVGERSQVALVLKPKLHGLSPGPYAVGFVNKLDCESGETSAVNRSRIVSGLTVTAASRTPDRGGLPNQVRRLVRMDVARNGFATAKITVPRMTLADLLNRSITIRSASGDPSGGQACGAIR